MKQVLLFAMLFFFGFLNAQTVKFSEDFESLPLEVTSSGSSNWARSSILQVSGTYCDSATIVGSTADTTILTTNAFSTTGFSHVILEFMHIAKLSLFDGGYIEVSDDNGVTWTRLADDQYYGNGSYGISGVNVFNAISYLNKWKGADNLAIPTNSWWRGETFDLSYIIPNAANAKIRFVLTGNTNTTYGWLIDDIEVKVANTDLTPPTITMIPPFVQDTAFTTGPFEIKVNVADSSGVNNVALVYTVGGVNDTVPMTHVINDEYKGFIPSQAYGTDVCYQVIAFDSLMNYGANPKGNCISYVTKKDPNAPPVFAYDVALDTIMNPLAVTIANINTGIDVRIANRGDSLLTKATIAYEVDGVSQTSFNWAGSLSLDMISNTFTIDSAIFTPGPHSIKVYAYSPNDSLDQDNSNDTIEMSIYACNDILSGTYTLGGNGADFVDFDDLLNALKYCGLDGPTVVKVNPGVYETSLAFTDSIIGLDSINTLTIVSSTNNRDDVIVNYTRTSQTNYVIQFNNVNYITFKSISVRALGNSANNYSVVKILDGSSNIVIDDCDIISSFGNVQDNAILISGQQMYNNTIKNSNIQGGYYGVSIVGGYNDYILKTYLINNTISEFYRHGINTNYTTALEIDGNTLIRENRNTSTTLYAVNIYHANNVKVTNNSVDIMPDNNSVGAGIRLQTSGGSSNNLSLVANNTVTVRGTTSSYVRGIHIHSSNYVKVVYNSVSLQSGSATSAALYFENQPGNNIIMNNNLAALNGGMGFSVSVLPINNTFDYNNYYTTGLVLIKVGSNTSSISQGVTGISALTKGDTNSVITSPMYYSNTDLHSFSPALNGAGTPIVGVTTDFEGDVRDSSTPDIGADEFSISTSDVGVVGVLNPLPVDTQANVVDVELIIQNFGSVAVTAMDIKYMINNGTVVNYAWTGNIAPATSDTVIVGSVTLPGGTYSLTAYTDLSSDTLNYNDTISINRYAQPLIDAEVESLEQPIGSCNMGANEVVQIVIRNHGVGYIYNGLSASYQIGNLGVITENVLDTIGPGDSTLFTFSQTVDMTTGYQDSSFAFKVKAIHASDANSQNDSAFYTIVSRAHLYAPIVSDTTINYGDTVTLTAISNDPIRWFENDTTTTILANGDYLTPHLFDTTTYYAQTGGTAPPAQVSIGTGTGTWNQMNKSVYGGGDVFGGITRSEIVYKSSELLALGLSAGPITSIAFNTTAAFSAPPTFEISIGHTTANSTTNYFITTPLQTVVSSTFTAIPGWNTHTFSAPFIWDGVSNIVVQVCTGGSSSAPPVVYTTTNYNSYLCAGGWGWPTVTCTTPAGLSYDRNKRPNTRFTGGGSQLCTSVKVPLVVTVPFPAIDAMVSDITNPTDDCGLITTPVTIDIVGMGTDTIFGGFTATYKVDNGSFVTPEIINDTILSGDTLHYTFTTLASLAPGANGTNYTITAKVVVPNDAYAANDSLTSGSIFSKYTPTNPIVTDMIVNYSDSALLTASASDSIYWYADSATTILAGEGSSYMSNPIYDTTVFYAVSQRTIPTTVYTIGTGTITNSPTLGPSPYGAGGNSGYGPMASRTQILITAAELSAQGMIQGPINSVSFFVATYSGSPLKNYTIKMGHTTRTDMDGSYFQTNLTTVYNRIAYTDGLLWNKHEFDNSFFWDGVSNIIVETYFKNTAPVSYARVYHTVTTDNSVAFANGGASYNYADSAAYYNSKNRPNMRFDQTGLGLCISDAMPLTITVPSYPQHDAALTEIVEPIGNVSSVVASPVKVVLKNFGLTTMTAATINWSEKGVAQTPYTWSGSLAHGAIDTVTIDPAFIFSGGLTELKAWVSLTGDTVYINDTIVETVSACMSGAYTINPLTGDYHSFNEAVNEMSLVGICGPVVFNVDSGTYGEKIILYPITGSSATNTVTFQSSQMDSMKVTLTATTLQNDNYVFKIDGASNIIIQNLGLAANGSQYGNVIVLGSGAHDIVIKNNRIMGTSYYGNTSYASGVYTSVQGVHDIHIENNYFGYSYSAIYLKGSSSNYINGFVIKGNEFIGYTKHALSLRYANEIVFNSNKLVSSTQGSQVYAIYSIYNEGLTIRENHITIGSTNANYVFYFNNTSGTATQHNLIANNFISVVSGVGNTYGVYLNGCNYFDIVYNSINIIGGNSSSKAVFLSNGSHMNIKNNSIATKMGYALYAHNIPSNIDIDYNNLYVDTLTSGSFVHWSSDQADIAALIAFDPSNNQQSISDNPEYYSATDLHSQQVSMYNTANPYPGITIDIDNEVRNTSTPSIGADEFLPPAIDLGIINMPYPLKSDCGYSATDSLLIRIKNHGLNNLNFANTNASIVVIVSGASTDTITYVINAGLLNSGQDTTITVSSNYDLSVNGSYTFQAKVSIAGDGNTSNDDMVPVIITSYPNINSFPFSEDFESGQNITFKLHDEVYSSVGVSSSAANNSNNGLHFQGGVTYTWSHQYDVEGAFLNNPAHVATAVTCNVDANNITALSLQFDLRQTRYMASDTNTSWFRVLLVDANNTIHYLKNIKGDSVFKAKTTNTDPFQNHTFNLNSYLGQNFEIRFEALNKTAYGYGSFEGDNAFLDNVVLWTPYPNDVGVKKIVSNALHGKVGDNFIVKTAFMNMGSDTLYTVPLAYQVNGGVIIRDTVNGVFLPSVTDTFTFAIPHTIVSGIQNVCVFSELPNDSDPSNDMACIDVMGMSVFAVDYMDDFETADDWFAYGGLNQWQKGTPTTTNINSAHSGQNAWVTMLSSNYQAGKEEYLYTPYFTIPYYANAGTLEFWMFMDLVVPNAYGQMEFSFNGVNWAPYGYIGSTNSINWYNQSISGMHVWSQANTGWAFTSIELDSTIFNNSQPFQLRFKFTTGLSTTTADGWAIDDFKITIPSFAKDAGVNQILNPISSTVTGDSIVVEVEVKNFGTDTLTTVPVTYTIDGTIVAAENWTGSLLHSEVDTFTFTTKYLASGVNYDICAYTSMPSDMQLHNDTVCASIVATPGKIDAGISAVIAPAGQSTIGQATTVKIMIRNFGTDTLKNIPVEYLMNGGSKANEVYNGSIAPGDSAEYTFTTTYVSGVGVYSICGKTNMPNDVDATNDLSCVTVVGTSIDMSKGNVFAVAQNQPNPVDGQTSIEFFIPKSGKVQLKIVNALGEVIENQEFDYQTGSHKIVLNTQSYQSGVYYYAVTFEGAVKTFKMIVVR